MAKHGVQIFECLAPDPRVEDILARHHALMRAQSPEESCHVLSAEELRASGARLFGAHEDAQVLGIGAFVRFDEVKVELKSMHTVAQARGKGIGALLLEHLLDEATRAGARSAWLETGSDPAFAPARALYTRFGFDECPPFADYALDPLSVFLTKAL